MSLSTVLALSAVAGLNVMWSILLMGAVTIAYTLLGGMKDKPAAQVAREVPQHLEKKTMKAKAKPSPPRRRNRPPGPTQARCRRRCSTCTAGS